MFPKPVSEASVRIADYTSRWILSGWRPSTNLACFQITRAATDIRIREGMIIRAFQSDTWVR